MSINLKPTLTAYYLTVSRAEVIEIESEEQRIEIPDKRYSRVMYLEPNLPGEFIEQELEKQLQKIFERMRREENDSK